MEVRLMTKRRPSRSEHILQVEEHHLGLVHMSQAAECGSSALSLNVMAGYRRYRVVSTGGTLRGREALRGRTLTIRPKGRTSRSSA